LKVVGALVLHRSALGIWRSDPARPRLYFKCYWHLMQNTVWLLWDIQLHGRLLQLQMDEQKDLQCDKFAWLHNSFFCGRAWKTQPVNNLASICVVFCCLWIEAGRSCEECHITVSTCPLKMRDVCFVDKLVPWVFIAMCWLVTN
jgi:hypothetical protein